ncbi:MAG: DUF4115 domain-containing protein [Rhodobacteraceae bacterium]|nr:DUF4115 domain-containing protein [Paracoccaceae bacterium]
MIGRKTQRKSKEPEIVKPKGFDDFDLRLGDMMRGERATLGKSLLDVQRELRIKAAYIAAIENSDPEVFDTPGFIAGYVRSYARYLGMDPDKVFETFCLESGFKVAHGMSAGASVIKKSGSYSDTSRFGNSDPFASSGTPFSPVGDGMLAQIELRAIGSILILIALIAGIGYGGWSVLRQIQQVQFAPVEQAPEVLSSLDPVNVPSQPAAPRTRGFSAPSIESLDRLYRPQALDVPVLVARDAPISTLDPTTIGNFAAPKAVPAQPLRVTGAPALSAVPQVVELAAPNLRMVAVRMSWVRVKSADGTVIFEATMQPGDSWETPLTEEPPVLRTGDSGAIYFAMGDKFFGPVGPSGSVTSNVPLSIAGLQESYPQVVNGQDRDLVRYAQAQGLSIGDDDN